jgi:hypothetical protein
VLGHEPFGDLGDFSLLVGGDCLQWLSIFPIGSGLYLDKYQHLALLRDYINLSRFIPIVFLDNPVSLFLEKFDRRLLAFLAKM